jgi:hypothetical protein
MIRALFASLLLALSACAAAQQAPAAPAWFVTRHLQKAEGADPALTPQGRACAVRLAERLAGESIGAIYVSSTRRARETAAPLAERLGETPLEYDPRDTPALVARLRQEGGRVLVVGHSNTVPDIVAGLGGARPAAIADDRYGDLWLVSADGGATSQLRIDGC